MIRVGFAGVPGAGKTSTARGLASVCRRLDGLKNVELCAEYARRYIAKYGAIESVWEQFRILKKQIDWEDTVGAADLILTDAPVFLGFMYAQMLNSGSAKDVMLINDLFNEMNKLNSPMPRYDLIFHLPPKVEAVRDGVRPESNFDPEWRSRADAQLKAAFLVFKPCVFYTVQATGLTERVEECLGVLQKVIQTPPGTRRSLVGVDLARETPSMAYFCEINGIIHACDIDGRSQCDRGIGEAKAARPDSPCPDCPVCFGGGSA